MSSGPFLPVIDPVYTQPLTKPFKAGNTEITEITIRKPNGEDLLMVGSPVLFDPISGKPPKIDYPVAYEMVSRISNIPVRNLQQADPADMLNLFWMISTFFTVGLQTSLQDLMKSREVSQEQVGTPEI